MSVFRAYSATPYHGLLTATAFALSGEWICYPVHLSALDIKRTKQYRVPDFYNSSGDKVSSGCLPIAALPEASASFEDVAVVTTQAGDRSEWGPFRASKAETHTYFTKRPSNDFSDCQTMFAHLYNGGPLECSLLSDDTALNLLEREPGFQDVVKRSSQERRRFLEHSSCPFLPGASGTPVTGTDNPKNCFGVVLWASEDGRYAMALALPTDTLQSSSESFTTVGRLMTSNDHSLFDSAKKQVQNWNLAESESVPLFSVDIVKNANWNGKELVRDFWADGINEWFVNHSTVLERLSALDNSESGLIAAHDLLSVAISLSFLRWNEDIIVDPLFDPEQKTVTVTKYKPKNSSGYGIKVHLKRTIETLTPNQIVDLAQSHVDARELDYRDPSNEHIVSTMKEYFNRLAKHKVLAIHCHLVSSPRVCKPTVNDKLFVTGFSFRHDYNADGTSDPDRSSYPLKLEGKQFHIEDSPRQRRRWKASFLEQWDQSRWETYFMDEQPVKDVKVYQALAHFLATIERNPKQYLYNRGKWEV